MIKTQLPPVESASTAGTANEEKEADLNYCKPEQNVDDIVAEDTDISSTCGDDLSTRPKSPQNESIEQNNEIAKEK